MIYEFKIHKITFLGDPRIEYYFKKYVIENLRVKGRLGKS